MSSNDFEDLRNYDDFEGDFDDNEIAFDGEAAAAASSGGMSSVEQIILGVFVLLNLVALVVIILLITGVLNP